MLDSYDTIWNTFSARSFLFLLKMVYFRSLPAVSSRKSSRVADRDNDCYWSCLCFNYGHCHCGVILCARVADIVFTSHCLSYALNIILIIQTSTIAAFGQPMLILFKSNWSGKFHNKRTFTKIK